MRNRKMRLLEGMRQVLIFVLRRYRKLISPLLGNHCRFFPSCSSYAEATLAGKGIFLGIALTTIRLLKCHPFHPGGVDPIE